MTAQYKDNLEVSAEKTHAYVHECIIGIDSVLELVTQMQKYFSKSRLKRGDRLVFINVLIAHNEEIEEVIRDVKHSLERCKIRIEVQCMQYPEVVKI